MLHFLKDINEKYEKQSIYSNIFQCVLHHLYVIYVCQNVKMFLYGHIKHINIQKVIKLHFEEKTKPNLIERPFRRIESV